MVLKAAAVREVSPTTRGPAATDLRDPFFGGAFVSRFSIRLSAVALVVFLISAPRARADTIALLMETNGTVTTYNPYGGPTKTVGSGPFHWTQQAPTNANFPQTLTTYCIDLDQYIYLGNTHTFTVQPNIALSPTINGEAKAAAITELFDRYYQTGLTSTANQNAFQLALWDLVYDGPTERSLSAGRVQAPNDLAQSMLSSLGTPYSNHDLTGSKLYALVSDAYQDQIVVVPNPPAHAPAPPAALLAGIGLLALFARARWMRS